MRLLQVSLQSFLLYALVLVSISIPISFFTIRGILNHEVDESIILHRDQFLQHLKNFEYLDDLETDLMVLDQLTYDISIRPSSDNLQKESLATISSFDSLEMEERPFRVLVSPVRVKNKPYILTIRESLVENEELATAIGLLQAVVIVLLAVGFIFINRALSGSIWLPFYSTLNKLKKFELDQNKSFEAEPSRIEEFNDLNAAIHLLTEKNKDIFQQQKEFTENASHEMQTPLAILQSKLDILMQSPELTETQAVVIQEMEANSQRMARLNKNLLLLSKIDNAQFAETETVEMAATIFNISANLKPLTDLQGIAIDHQVADRTVVGNKTLIEVLVSNLLTNALRYSKPHERVNIFWDGVTFEVSNRGRPLTLPVEKLFERFRKENKHPQSSGLGLSIVKKICDTCGYGLHYKYENESHYFAIVFKPEAGS